MSDVLFGNITIMHYVILSGIIFSIGSTGLFINKKTLVTILMSLELMLFAININFVAFSVYLGDFLGQIFVIFILTVAAAEVAIGLAIIVVYFRNRNTIDVSAIKDMKG